MNCKNTAKKIFLKFSPNIFSPKKITPKFLPKTNPEKIFPKIFPYQKIFTQKSNRKDRQKTYTLLFFSVLLRPFTIQIIFQDLKLLKEIDPTLKAIHIGNRASIQLRLLEILSNMLCYLCLNKTKPNGELPQKFPQNWALYNLSIKISI